MFVDDGVLFGQVEYVGDLLHLGIGHAGGNETHRAGIPVDDGALGEGVNHVECFHYVGAHGENTVLFPHHNVVIVVEFADGGFG